MLTTLVLVLLIASVVALTQARLNAGRMTFARLQRAQTDALAETAVRERLRLLLAELLTTPDPATSAIPLDGTVFRLAGDGYTAEVQINDVAGQADLYYAPPALLQALPTKVDLTAGRARVAEEVAGGVRYLVVEQTLGWFGVAAAERRALTGLVTQSGTPGQANIAHAPPELRTAMATLGLPQSVGITALSVRVGITHDK